MVVQTSTFGPMSLGVESAKENLNISIEQKGQPRTACGAEGARFIGLQGATHPKMVASPGCCRLEDGTCEFAARGAVAQAGLVARWLRAPPLQSNCRLPSFTRASRPSLRKHRILRRDAASETFVALELSAYCGAIVWVQNKVPSIGK